MVYLDFLYGAKILFRFQKTRLDSLLYPDLQMKYVIVVFLSPLSFFLKHITCIIINRNIVFLLHTKAL